MEECESHLTACIHEGYMFMRKVLGGIELLWPEIHHSWAKTMNVSFEIWYSKKNKNKTVSSFVFAAQYTFLQKAILNKYYTSIQN